MSNPEAIKKVIGIFKENPGVFPVFESLVEEQTQTYLVRLRKPCTAEELREINANISALYSTLELWRELTGGSNAESE